MANLNNIRIAIQVMQRVADSEHHNFNIHSWQSASLNTNTVVKTEQTNTVVKTEQEAMSCGTSACFAGWLAISPEGRAGGLTCGYNGAPRFKGHNFTDAIALFLGITEAEALSLVAPGRYSCDDPNASDVLLKLYALEEIYESENKSPPYE